MPKISMPQLLPLNIQRTEQLVAPKQQIKIQSRQDRQINEEGERACVG